MIVRELVALLGVKSDPESFKKAEGKMSKLSSFAKTAIAGVVAVGGYMVTRWIGNMVTMASSATENLNVLEVVFRQNQKTITDWADSFAEATGRSAFELREFAGDIGGVLKPMLDGNIELTTQMSKRLSELAVDLGSLREVMPEEALRALRSGIIGQSEPMLQFGVNLQEASLKAFALEQGITKSVQKMTVAEKTMLRYNLILARTTDAHGDAAKTSGSFANASKALAAKLKDSSIKMGMTLLPTLEDAIQLFLGWADGASDLIMTLGRVFRVVGKVVLWVVKLGSRLSPLLLSIGAVILAFKKWGAITKFLFSPFGKILLLVGALILIFDDLMTWMEGGDSVIGKFVEALDEMTGLPISTIVKDWIKWFMMLAEDPVAAFLKLGQNIKMGWGEAMAFLTDTWNVVVGYFLGRAEFMSEGLKEFFGSIPATVKKILGEDLYNFMSSWGGMILDVLLWPFRQGMQFVADTFVVGIGGALDRLWSRITGWLSSLGSEISNIPFIGKFFSEAESPTRTRGLGPKTVQRGMGRGQTTNNNNNQQANTNITINAPAGMSEARLMSEAKKKFDNSNRAAMRSLSSQAG